MSSGLDHLYATYIHRFLAEGVHYRDLLDIQARTGDMSRWCPVWSEFAQAAEERADRALATGLTATAATELTRASIYYFFAQFVLWHDPAAKRAAYERSARTLRRAAPYLDPALERMEIPFQDVTMPAYLHRPNGVAKPPCVILLGGLDTTKEEQLVISSLCVQRGLATLAFDGPGQGETFPRMRLGSDFDRSIYAVLDFIETRPEIDSTRLGVIGRSLGSYYASKSAAIDKRIKAAVAWGAMYHLRNYEVLPPLIQAGFLFVTGSKTLEEARPYFESVNLEGLASGITCPLLIVHGGRDRITPRENATRIAAEAKGLTEMLFWEDSYHCAHDRSHVVRPAMADFMLKHL